MMQNNRLVVVITGGIGTGKTAVSDILRKKGYKVLDSDKIVHDGYKPGNKMYLAVKDAFGTDILDENGFIDRRKLGAIVFNDEKKLRKLNDIVHGAVVDVLAEGIKGCGEEVIFLDIPLFFEEREKLKHRDIRYDQVWLAYVNPHIQKERLTKRALIENKNPDEVLKIIEKQIPIEEKRRMADEIIVNEGTLKDLQKEIEMLLEKKHL